MSDPTKALDAHETAKPDEPTFTLQGGDPLAAVLVRLWAKLARVQSGRLGKAAALEMQSGCFEVASRNRVTSEHEINELLTRATAAEQVSWDMDAYLKGEAAASQPEPTGGKSLTAKDRLDVWDLCRRGAGFIGNAIYELGELHDELEKRGFGQDSINAPGDMLALVEIRTVLRELTTLRNRLKR